MDIAIPYNGTGESIIYALRSIEKNFPHDVVYVITDKPCPHLKNVVVVPISDTHTSNKDANIIDKVLGACKFGMQKEFMFWSDDQVCLKEHEPYTVFNNRGPLVMRPTCKWEQRLVRTGYFIRDMFHKALRFNFDSHVPQKMDRDNFLQLENIDYQSGLGFTICTLYFGIFGFNNLAEQRAVKATFEGGHFDESEITGKLWIGWDRQTYEKRNLKSFLETLFPHKSKFEA